MSYTRPIRTATATTTSAQTSTPPNGTTIRCTGHDKPAVRLECKNGNNRGRFFYKCSMVSDEDKCRFFHWEDGVQSKTASNTSNTFQQPPAMRTQPQSFTPPASSAFSGGGQTLSRGDSRAQASSGNGVRTFSRAAVTPATPSKSPLKSQSSGSSTEYTPSPSPSKRKRTDWGAAPTSTLTSSSSPSKMPPPSSQTVEEAIDEEWDDDMLDDIAEFDGSASQEAQTKSPKPTFNKFTSFSGVQAPTTPKHSNEATFESGSGSTQYLTPPRLQQGLPITPKSAGGGGAESAASKKWQTMMEDADTPWKERRDQMFSPGAKGKEGTTASGTNSQDLANHLFPTTPSPTEPVDATPAPDTPSRHLQTMTDQLSNLQTSVESASRSTIALERQLKAAQQKAAYHEKREKEARAELEEMRKKVRTLQHENEVLRSGML